MVITLEIYREVRQLHLQGVSQRQIAKRLGIDRKTVKKYVHGEHVPWEERHRERPASVLTPEVTAFIRSCLEEDKETGGRKQKHTARRIYHRLVDELGFTGAESTVRNLVRELRETLPEVYVPLAFDPGEAVQIDWGEATIWLAGEKRVVNLFCARLCYSDAMFVAGYRRQNSESFQEALIRTFSFFGGTPRKVIFDNAKVAVKDGFGANAAAQDNYAALAAHYGFEPVFCNPASGNEKGLVEGLVGFSRRNFCVPVPRVESMDELNILLEKGCRKYMTHKVQGKSADVGTLYKEEQEKLYPLPGYQYDPARRSESRVGRFSTVRYDTNVYSVPVAYAGKSVSVKALPEKIEVYCSGECIAVHQRSFARHQSIYRLEHYLPLLERKGRAIFQAKPVRDNVPPYFLDWLRQQDLKPKELTQLLEQSLEIGFDAVMRSELPSMAPPPPVIQDPVAVAVVDLSAYDKRFLGKGVNV